MRESEYLSLLEAVCVYVGGFVRVQQFLQPTLLVGQGIYFTTSLLSRYKQFMQFGFRFAFTLQLLSVLFRLCSISQTGDHTLNSTTQWDAAIFDSFFV